MLWRCVKLELDVNYRKKTRLIALVGSIEKVGICNRDFYTASLASLVFPAAVVHAGIARRASSNFPLPPL